MVKSQLLLGVFLFIYAAATAQLTVRYTNNIKGDLLFVANNNISCGVGSGNCTKNNTTPFYSGPENSTLNNNSGNNYTSATLTYFNDIDGDATTFNSSSANYVLPSGTLCPEVMWAGLYWGAEATSGTITGVPAAYTTTLTFANRNKVRFKVPGSSTYQTITAASLFTNSSTYHCFADVTSIVKAAGVGTYTTANIVSSTSTTQKDGGWNLVIIYADQNAPKRNLSVFDGMVAVSSTNPSVLVPISGFATPPTGPIMVRCGLVVYDGDRSSISDSLAFRGANGTNFPNFVNLTDATHAVNNVFNSAISNYGSIVTTRSPADNNTLGYDASLFNVPNTGNSNLGNSATAATLKFTTGSEAYRIGTVVTMIDIVDPEFLIKKSAQDINGGTLLPGDILEYTIRAKNTGNDTAINTLIFDTIPYNTNYVAGSMLIDGVAVTDAAGDDRGNFDGTRVNFRVGIGANATVGGKVKVGDSVTVKFRVQITNDCAVLRCSNKISNFAYSTCKGFFSNATLNSTSNPNEANPCAVGPAEAVLNFANTCSTPPDTSMLITCPSNFIQLENKIILDGSGTNVSSQYTLYYTDAALTTPIAGTANITSPGIYYAVRPITIGCVDTVKITVNQQPQFTAASITKTDVTCNGAANGTASITATGASAPYTYAWLPSGGSAASTVGLLPATYTVTVTDVNSCTTTQTVTITQPSPLIFSTTNTAIACASNTSTITVTASGGVPSYQYKINAGLYQASNVLTAIGGTHTITVQDANGCTNSATINIVPIDAVPPAIACPTSKTLYAGASCDAVGTLLAATATDNCAVASVSYTTSGSTVLNSPATGINDISGATFALGTTIVTYTAKDGANNSASCSFTITVVDTTKPILSCPSNQTVNVNAGLCVASGLSIASTATDNCSLSKLTYAVTGATSATSATTGINNASSVVFNKGVSTVTYTATDNAGNTSVCSFTVTVIDNIVPTIACPANISQSITSGCASAVANIAPISVADNCGTTSVSYSVTGATVASGTTNASGVVFNKGLSTVTYTVSDGNGNTANCSFTVNIEDVIPPTILCPSTASITLDANCNGTIPLLATTVSDNCTGTITQQQSPAAGTTVNGSSPTAVTITVTDASGNTSSCVVNVSKADVTPPVLTCPGAQTIALNNACTAVIPNYTTLATANDACSGSSVTITQAPPAGSSISGTGITTVTITAVDASNNSVTCTFTLDKQDITPPTIICPPTQTLYLGASCNATVPNYTTLASASDPCSVTTITQDPAAGSTINAAGTTVFTLTATDASNNSTTCSFSVNVIDSTKPVIACPVAQNVIANAGTCVATGVNLSATTATDNCGLLTITNNAPATFPLGTTTYTVVATDINGNTATCTAQIVVSDAEPPVLACPSNQSVSITGASCNAQLSNIAAVVSDNCSISSLSYTTTGATVGSSVTTGINDASVVSFALGSTTVTYLATDASGNSSTCSFVITVNDVAPPVITCPAAVTAYANASCKATPSSLALASSTDVCGIATTTFAISGATTASGTTNATGTVFNLGTSTLVYTVTDASANSATCSVVVDVVDTTKPNLTCPVTQVINLNGGCTASLPDYTSLATISDNCTPSTSTVVTQAPAAGTPISGTGALMVTLTAADAAGNTTSCTFNVTKVNQNTPAINCPAPQTLYLGVACSASLPDYTSQVVVSAACSGSSGNTVVQTPAPGTVVSDTGTITLKFVVTDISGNQDSCYSIVTKLDTVAPQIICPAAQTVYLNANCEILLADYTLLSSATDACTPANAISITQVPAANTILTASGNLDITLTATDGSGNVSTCIFSVNKVDTTKPSIVCPSTVNVVADAGACAATNVSLGTPVTADNCGVQSVVNNAPSSFPVGTTTFTITVTDVNGNTATCTQQVVVTDTEAPSITCPSTVNVVADAGACAATNVSLGTPVTADNCAVQSVVNNAPSSFAVGTTTFTITVTDINGNTATCTQQVVVTDTEAPTITCPSTVNVVADAGACTATNVSLGTPVTADNCGVQSVVNNAPSSFAVGTTTFTITVTDINGNTATCTQQVVVTDTEAPSITCPTTVNVVADAGACTATNVSLGTPVTADNCAVQSVVNNAPSSFAVGTTTFTITVTDVNGNTATCTQQVVVTDTEAPTITCPSTVNVVADAGACAATNVSLGTPVTSDNCAVQSVVNNAPSSFAVGTTTFTITVTDVNGNTATCTQQVVVTDTEQPSIVCPANVNATALPGICSNNNIVLTVPTVADNCGIASIVSNAPSVYQLGQTVVQFTVTDVHGNTNSCNTTVTIVDNEPPTIACPLKVVATADAGTCAATNVSLGTPVTSDNCSVASVLSNAPSVFPVGTTVFTITVTDGSGNTATCTQLVQVLDLQAPQITCPATITINANVGQCYATAVNIGAPTVSDNCGIQNISNNAPTIFPVGSTIFTITATDLYGNTATCLQEVVVVDTQAPQIACALTKTVSADVGLCTASNVAIDTPMVSDNCGIALVVNNAPAIFPLGTTIFTVTATDVHGNTATCTQQIIVADQEAPTISCPSNQFISATTGLCTGIAPAIGLTYADNCGMASVTYVVTGATNTTSAATGFNDASVVPFNKGESTVTYTATDMSGNIATCTFKVQVLDLQKPTFVCPSNITLAASATCDATIANASLSNVADNCGAVFVDWYISGATTLSGTNDVTGQVLNKGVNNAMYVVYDLENNRDTCNFTITVNDSTMPEVICPPTQTILLGGTCSQVLPNFIAAGSASDNCDVLGAGLSIAQYPAAGTSVSGVGTTVVVLVATDAAGNTDTCQFDVVKINANPPILNCIAAQNIYLAVNCTALMPDFTSSVVAVDICNQAAVTITQVPAPGVTIAGTGTMSVKFIATDAFNNKDSCTAILTKLDTLAPVITCPLAQELFLDNACSVVVPDFTSLGMATDACTPSSNIVFTQAPAPGTILNTAGAFSVTLFATDSSGNTSFCDFPVVKIDTVAPTLTCPAAVNTVADLGQCFASNVNIGTPINSDGCSLASITNDAPTIFPIGITTITYIASDVNGNSSSCTQTVTVVDTQLPTIICPNAVVLNNANGVCTQVVTTLSAVVQDNCAVQSLTYVIDGATQVSSAATGINDASGVAFNVGTSTLKYIVTDIHGNIDSCATTIVIIDTAKPNLLCHADTASFATASTCDAPIANLAPIGVADNCGIDSIKYAITGATVANGINDASGIVFNTGTSTVTYTITDINGNASVCAFSVTIIDTTKPGLTCLPDTLIRLTGATCLASGISLASPVATDNCGIASVTASTTATNFGAGLTTIVYTATDIHGNMAMCTRRVLVVCTDTVTLTFAASGTTNTACADLTQLDTTGGVVITTCGTPAGYIASLPDANGCITYTPTGTQSAQPDTTCIITYANGVYDTLIVLLVPPPTVNPDVNITFVNTPVLGNVSTNDPVVPLGIVYGNATSTPANPDGGTAVPVVNTDGSYTFTAGTAGVYNFVVPIVQASGDTIFTALQITVLDTTNTVPPAANTDIASTSVGTSVTINTLSNDVASNFGGGVGLDPSTVAVVLPPANGTATVDPLTGNIIYTPNAGFVGVDTIVYSVEDSLGNLVSAYQIVTVIDTATSENTTTASDDYNAVNSIAAVSGDVLDNDTDAEGDSQTVVPQSTSIPGIGTLVLQADGTYTFTPVPGYVGPASFVYTVLDARGASAKATLYFIIDATNQPLSAVQLWLQGNNVAGVNHLVINCQNTDGFAMVQLYRLSKNGGNASVIYTNNQLLIGANILTYLDRKMLDNINYYYAVATLPNGVQLQSNTIVLATPQSSDLIVYPNPTKDIVNIEFGSVDQEAFSVRVLDISGRVVKQHYGKASVGKNVVSLSLEDLANGNYMVTVQIGTRQVQHLKVNKE
jgi:hypothetical protein